MDTSAKRHLLSAAIGFAALLGATAASAPAQADDWRHHRGGPPHGHYHDHRGGPPHGYYHGHRGPDRRVVVRERHRVIVRDRPVYVAPPPAYYAPPTGYYQPGFSLFLGLD